MNNKGRGGGIALLVILIAALLAALLAVRSVSSPAPGGNSAQVEQENLVRQTQEVVDQLNQRQRQSGLEP